MQNGILRAASHGARQFTVPSPPATTARSIELRNADSQPFCCVGTYSTSCPASAKCRMSWCRRARVRRLRDCEITRSSCLASENERDRRECNAASLICPRRSRSLMLFALTPYSIPKSDASAKTRSPASSEFANLNYYATRNPPRSLRSRIKRPIQR